MLDTWIRLDELAERRRLPRGEMPHAGLAATMHAWASGTPIELVLERSGIGAGDFVRWTKQTIDLLDQIAQACEAAELADLDAERLGALARLARDAKHRVRRGIVETSSAGTSSR
ncbi:hypothetical protein [Leucobacter allii]|uniref:hypothetical protein n=1 Tax=Leucobacter allii TaxID=2932247 RepID=UPI003211B069